MTEKNKNLISRDISLIETVNNANLALEAYNKGLLKKDELDLLIGINLKSGDPIKVWDILYYHQFLMKLRDLDLVTDGIVRKQLFGLPPLFILETSETKKKIQFGEKFDIQQFVADLEDKIVNLENNISKIKETHSATAKIILRFSEVINQLKEKDK